MATVDITEKTFQTLLNDHEIVLIDFWAGWCAPCRSFAPTYSAASEKHPDIAFAKVDTEAEQAFSAKAGISSIPTLMAFSQPGALDATALEQVIAEVKAPNMQDVHAGLAAQNAAVNS